MTTSRLLVLSFAGAILIGTVILWLPFSTAGEGSLSLTDSLFMATSGICVTGLIVVETGEALSLFGQVVILILIQAGGLGILTFSNLLLIAAGRKLGLSERILVEETHGGILPARSVGLVRRVFFYTFTIESAGALLLFARFRSHMPFETALWSAVFHSVSAFCNAGFSLYSTSFMDYSADLYVNLIMTGLIILGGLGFVVMADIASFLRSKTKKESRHNLSLHSRSVLYTTLILIIAGAVLIGILESDNLLKDRPLKESILTSIFLSITPRTAGFNTLDTGSLTTATLLTLIPLMIIGASPGSTGGGIKTTTFAATFALVKSELRQRTSVELLNRQIPNEIIIKALATIVGFLLVLFTGVFLLQITESWAASRGVVRGRFIDYLFETASALGTVGLSTGITPVLSTAGKYIIIICMFVGRLGPLAVATSLIGRRTVEQYRLPEEKLMVG
jgi:trk system potassium uptake protein TrkH